LKSDDFEILLRLVDKHMLSHENDLEKSLAGVNPSTDVLGELQTLAVNHPELEQSLVPLRGYSHLACKRPGDYRAGTRFVFSKHERFRTTDGGAENLIGAASKVFSQYGQT
jgi:hypothetical protein